MPDGGDVDNTDVLEDRVEEIDVGLISVVTDEGTLTSVCTLSSEETNESLMDDNSEVSGTRGVAVLETVVALLSGA